MSFSRKFLRKLRHVVCEKVRGLKHNKEKWELYKKEVKMSPPKVIQVI